ncbi:unnamed protein product [Candidula unifasciata]|uniref:CABIT domain-containing protein n=1 Tax=Candidula unifasciata TaxID=100452 RepID=A0A8S3YYH3_9EUPU|nr:unnamed protein product [Candidula unifasciata]
MYSNNQQLNDVTRVPSMDFSDFISACAFPQCVCVTHGSFVSDRVQISRGDVLILKSCITKQVTLCVPNNADSSVKVNMTFDSGLKFKVLPPAHVDSSGNTIVYPTIADLLMDCPTHFEATTSYDDPYLPGMSVSSGDRFWFVRIIRDFKNGQERLQVRDSKDNTAILSQDCMGYFRPLKDDNEYSIRELIGIAPVQRRLLIVKSDVISDTKTIYNVYQTSDISRKENITQIHNENEITIKLECPVGDQHLPFPSDGIVYMNKPELTVVVSPYNDLETAWQIPAIANFQVRTYSPNDYEIPVTKLQKQNLCKADTLLDDELPVFMAPNAPSLVAPHIPIEIDNFVDLYCSYFPVIANVVSTAAVHPYLQQVLNGVDEIIICKLDVVKRLYVKDTKSDTVFALSKDVKLSFVEYPQQFKTVSELVHLPVGSEVIILEDIAADFPKPLSLRFGDVIRVTSNIPCIIKTKLAGGDCQVLKCDRIDPEAGGSTRLKLPLDFEVTMLLKTDENSSRLISMHDLLNGVVPIPSQSVTYVSEDVSNDAVHNLPTNLQILKSFRETCIVAKILSPSFTQTSQLIYSPQKDMSLMLCSSDDSSTLPNIGITLTSRLVLAFRDRFNVTESHEEAFMVDLIVPPIEKMTTVEFKERQRYLQDSSDYEDVESGSSSTVDEYGSTSDVTTRISSQSMLEKIQKNAKLDTVRRFRHALNPKYWRQTKPRPPPLPHPSTMGLTLFTLNQNKTNEIGSYSAFFKFTDDESTSLKLITARDHDEIENFYEELEINPCKPTMPAAPLCPNSAFTDPGYIPAPPSNNPPKLFPKFTEKQAASATSDIGTLCLSDISQAAHSKAKSFTENGEDHNRKHTSEIQKPLMRVKTWANHFGNSMGNRFSMRFKNDTPKGNTTNLVHDGVDCKVTPAEKTRNAVMCLEDRRFDSNLSLTRSKSQSELWDLNERRNCANSFSPVTLAYDCKDLPYFIENQIRREKQESTIHPSYNFQHSVSSKILELQTLKPKPRTLNKPLLLESDHCYQTLPQIINEQLTLNATDYSEHVETLPDDAKSSTNNTGLSLPHTVDNIRPPKPLPKPRNRTSTKV